VEQALVVGLITGTLYGLYALGLVLVFTGSGVLNFAQAELGTFTLFVCQVVVVTMGAPYLVGVLVAVLLAAGIGITFERLAVWPLRAAPRLTVAVATIAMLSLFIVLELKVFDAAPRTLNTPLHGSVRIFEVVVTSTQILSLALVVAIGGALAVFLKRTDFGLAVVAAAQDQEAVRFLGIPLARISIFTWGLAGALSATAALLIQPTIGLISPNTFGGIFVKALGASLIGGLSSMRGAFVGGIVVGVMEAEIRHLTLSSSLTGLPELVIFAMVVGMLVLRPQGLLGSRA
jgi:branched-chain amino acid transport system permease protein